MKSAIVKRRVLKRLRCWFRRGGGNAAALNTRAMTRGQGEKGWWGVWVKVWD